MKHPDCQHYLCDLTYKDTNLERINPKGEPFKGLCPEHYREWIQDSFAEFVEDNLTD